MINQKNDISQIEQIIETFRHEFNLIRDQGFLQSTFKGNRAVGDCFETAIGIKTNNRPMADFHDYIEIKVKRENSKSPWTLFTKSPDFPGEINSKILEKFGKPYDDNPIRKKLHTTINAENFNRAYNKYGFKLEIDEFERKLKLKIKLLRNNHVYGNEIFYHFDTLKNIIEGKCRIIAIVNAKAQLGNNGFEKFHYTDATLLTGWNFDTFLSSLRNRKIVYEIRIGRYESGLTHDHGSAFRMRSMKKTRWGEIFPQIIPI